MDRPLYDHFIDATPYPIAPVDLGKKPGKAKPGGKPGKSTPVAEGRIDSLSLTDTIGLGLYLGYLGALVIVTAFRPGVAGAAIGVGIAVLLGVPICWAKRRTLSRWSGRAGGGLGAVLARLNSAASPLVESRGARLATVAVLSLVLPILLTSLILFVAVYRGVSFEPLRQRQSIFMMIVPVPIGFICFLGYQVPPDRRGFGKAARATPVDPRAEAMRVEAGMLAGVSLFGLLGAIALLNGSNRWLYDGPALAIPLLDPLLAFSIGSCLVVALVSGYALACGLAFFLYRDARKRIGTQAGTRPVWGPTRAASVGGSSPKKTARSAFTYQRPTANGRRCQ